MLTTSNDGGRRKRLWIGAGVVTVLALVAVLALVLPGSGNPKQVSANNPSDVTTSSSNTTESPTTVPATTTTEAATTTTVPTTTTTVATTTTTEPPFTCPGGFCAHIDDISVEAGELVIEWTAFNYEPNTANLHAHFYYNIYDAIQVGTNWSENGAASQGGWQLTHDQPFFTAGSAVSIAAAPPGTTAICVVPTDSIHGVISADNAECVDIPPELLG